MTCIPEVEVYTVVDYVLELGATKKEGRIANKLDEDHEDTVGLHNRGGRTWRSRRQLSGRRC